MKNKAMSLTLALSVSVCALFAQSPAEHSVTNHPVIADTIPSDTIPKDSIPHKDTLTLKNVNPSVLKDKAEVKATKSISVKKESEVAILPAKKENTEE